MKKKIVSLVSLCLLFGMTSIAHSTLISDAQSWIDNNLYGIESVNVPNNTVKSVFWELTNASSSINMTFYHEDDPNYAFGLFPQTGPSIYVFHPCDEPLDSATARFYTENDKAKVVLTEHELYGGTRVSIHPFEGDTFGFWMGQLFDDGWNTGWKNVINTYDNTNWLSVKMDEASYLFFGDVNRDGYLDMTVHAESTAPVPEPATMLLFGSGLAGLAGISRKMKKSK